MSYRLEPGRPIADSIRRIGAEQTNSILTRFNAKTGEGEAVHEARKAIKRLRALLALIRPAIPGDEYGTLQEHLKTVARSVSALRDAQAMLATFVKLEAHDRALATGPIAAALHKHLQARHDQAGRHIDRAMVTAAKKTVKEVADGFKKLTFEHDGFTPIATALEENYRKARKAMAHAYDDGHDEAFHDWRKLVQRHWRYLQLLILAWPKGIQPHIALARELSEILGEDHDLSVLSALVMTESKHLGAEKAVAAYLGLCKKRQRALRAKAVVVGTRLFAEKPASFARRIRAYWEHAVVEDDDGDNKPARRKKKTVTLPR